MELDMTKLEEILDDSYQQRCYIVVDCDYNTLCKFFETVIPVLWPWWNHGQRPKHPYAYYLWKSYVTEYRPIYRKLAINYSSQRYDSKRFGYCDDGYYRSLGYSLYPKTLSQIINEVQLQIDIDILDLL